MHVGDDPRGLGAVQPSRAARGRKGRKILGGLGAVVAAAALLAGCGGGAASPSQVATAAGASSCNNSGFYIQSKITGNKSVIYDCRFAEKLPKCVTYSGSIASDSTETVQLLFANSLGAQKPACLSWLSTAEAQQAAASAAAKQKAYQQALSADAHAAWHAGYTADYSNVAAYELPNIYYKFLKPPFSCAQYAVNGCWKVEVVTRNGCPTALSVQLDQESNNTQVGTLYGVSGALGPQQHAVVEIDATQSQTLQGRIGTILCD